jgi:hypothetical protein
MADGCRGLRSERRPAPWPIEPPLSRVKICRAPEAAVWAPVPTGIRRSTAPHAEQPSRDHTATRLTIPEGTRATAMNNRLLRIAAARGMPVTIRRVSGSLLFWTFTDEDLRHAREVASHRHTARSERPRVRRRRA